MTRQQHDQSMAQERQIYTWQLTRAISSPYRKFLHLCLIPSCQFASGFVCIFCVLEVNLEMTGYLSSTFKDQ